jgi:hypothetical protein
MSKASKAHMERVRAIGCLICQRLDLGDTPASAHHVFDSVARSDWLTVPLCREHHQGGTGFHGLGQRAFERLYSTTEAELLALTIEALHG